MNASQVLVLTSTHDFSRGSVSDLTAREIVDIHLPSELRYLNEVLNWLIARAAHFRIIDPENSNLLVALDEAISNAIRHGNHNDPAKTVHVHAEFCEHEACFIVRDEGNGFDHHTLPDPCEPDNLLKATGRGVLLMQHIMDEVHFNERGNEVMLVKKAECPAVEKEGLKV